MLSSEVVRQIEGNVVEYNIGFAKQLLEAANGLKGAGHIIEESKRAVLYLSLLSIEVSLKYLLEKAGIPIKDIKNRSHNIELLLSDLDGCEIISGSIGNDGRYVPATRIRSRIVNPAYGDATIGNLLQGESKGASQYPNQIRYGPMPRHYPSDLMLECAVKVIEWAEQEGQTIRVRHVPDFD